jgi:hypothetical protein
MRSSLLPFLLLSLLPACVAPSGSLLLSTSDAAVKSQNGCFVVKLLTLWEQRHRTKEHTNALDNHVWIWFRTSDCGPGTPSPYFPQYGGGMAQSQGVSRTISPKNRSWTKSCMILVLKLAAEFSGPQLWRTTTALSLAVPASTSAPFLSRRRSPSSKCSLRLLISLLAQPSQANHR